MGKRVSSEVLYMGNHHSEQFKVIDGKILMGVCLIWGVDKDPIMEKGTPVDSFTTAIANQVASMLVKYGAGCSNFVVVDTSSYESGDLELQFLRPLTEAEAAKLTEQRGKELQHERVRRERLEEKERKQALNLLRKYPDLRNVTDKL